MQRRTRTERLRSRKNMKISTALWKRMLIDSGSEMQGKKLHTGRSRNDQVALDMKLYIREMRVRHLDSIVKRTYGQYLLKLMEENTETYHAGIYTSAEGAADHTGTSYGSLF